jgi:monoamine oxidase
MPRTPLAQSLRNLFSLVDDAERRDISPDEVRAERPSAATRRDFVKTLSGAALVLPAAQLAGSTVAPRIAIVGAGLAGLTCAYRLKQAGVTAAIYEASTRPGGRCWTRHGDFADGQIAEHGGELIDQSHHPIRNLAQELGLNLDNLLQAEKNGAEPFYYFNSQPYSYRDATNDLKQIWQKIHSDLSAAGYPTSYNSFTRRGWELDHMSITDWIQESVPGGINSRLGKLLDIAYNIEYGAESNTQSALNLIYLLGYTGPGQLRIFGPSNEKYHVRGGNDQIPSLLADKLANQIQLRYSLEAIERKSNATYVLRFRTSTGVTSLTADEVVVAVPFSILRSSVDLSKAGLRPLKMAAIQNLGMGTNSKLHLQFTDRYWESLGSNGETYSDTGYQNTWDVSRAQPGKSGILVNFTGGSIGASLGTGTPTARAQEFLQQVDPVLPGIDSKWNGKATIDFWPGNPYARGSYSYYSVGQYTEFGGIEGEQEGKCHFAGEHTSVDSQGYLNGAVETGERAAKEILSAL